MDALREYLSDREPGPVTDVETLLMHVYNCWPHLARYDRSKMHEGKLGRMEDPQWNPPVVSFRIERHGGAALGSVNAELQLWKVNVDECTAEWEPGGTRRIRPAGPRFDIKGEASRLAEHIRNGNEDDCLKWLTDHRRVQVHTHRALPKGGPRRTRKGRRQRLQDWLDRELEPDGWRRVEDGSRLTYTRETGSED
jgi:hypothetical protein